MKLTPFYRNDGVGFALSFDDQEPRKLAPSPEADQTSPRGCYVYGHFDKTGAPFYIGKGTGRRAWSQDRDPVWKRYVSEHLAGDYDVVILEDNLSSVDAEDLENYWIAQESARLLNLQNMARLRDWEATERRWTLINANRKRIADARALESSDPARAIAIYRDAIAAIAEYAATPFDDNLYGRLVAEEEAETGLRGELKALDRLTLCLCRIGRKDEAAKAAEDYFRTYRRDRTLRAALPILKRVGLPR